MRQRFCHDKHTFVKTKDVFCHDKHVFVATNMLSQQQQKVFVTIKMILVAVPANDTMNHSPETPSPETHSYLVTKHQALKHILTLSQNTLYIKQSKQFI